MITERQKSLYNYLLNKTTTNEFISKEDICIDLKELYPRHEEKTNEHLSTAFALIRKDIRAINSSDVYKIVVSSKKGYKIANKQEATLFIKRRFARDLKSLKINWNLRNKFSKNGQYQIADEEINEIKAFIDGGGING